MQEAARKGTALTKPQRPEVWGPLPTRKKVQEPRGAAQSRDEAVAWGRPAALSSCDLCNPIGPKVLYL